MTDNTRTSLAARNRALLVTIIFIGGIIFYTRFIPGSANDASRYGTIKSIVERHTLVLDDHLFPTIDKVFIHSHFYSDKPPIFSLIAALPYAALHLAGLTFDTHGHLTVYLTTLLMAGLPLLWYVYQLGRYTAKADSAGITRWGISVLFVMATMLWPYATVLTNHIPAAVLAGIAVLQLWHTHELTTINWVYLGLLLGLATVIDLGVVFLLVSVGAYLVIRLWHERKSLTIQRIIALPGRYLGGAAILVFIHWLVNRTITGDIAPAAMHPEFFSYPGSLFSPTTLTSVGWSATSFPGWLKYVWTLTCGNRGLFLFNPLVLVGVISLVGFLRRRYSFERRLLAGSFLLTYLLTIGYYSVKSTNAGGWAFSVRWFCFLIPLALAPLVAWYRESANVRLKNFVVVIAIVSAMAQFFVLGNAFAFPQPGNTVHELSSVIRHFFTHTRVQLAEWRAIL